MRLKLLLALGCLLSILTATAHADTWRSFLDKDSADIDFASVAFQISEEAARILENRTSATGRYLSLIQQMGDQFAERVSSDDTPEDQIRKLNDFFFKEHGFTADAQPDADKLVENVLLDHVLDNKRGVCMSLSMIYMQIAQRAGIELSGVSVPLHFFLRYDGHEPFNIETLDAGRMDLTDDFYKEKYFVEDWEPFYMESLDHKKMLAVFAANIASIMTQNGMPKEAVAWLLPLQEVLKEDVEVKTNLGNAYLMTGDQNQAMQWWLKAVEHN
ncbi:MAG: transglutaminase family protein, partial [Candidatus Omnitrophica bacterium]|nr:transglutaminase family protein [Candidatus Omnitrophota bacterium]